MRDRHAGQRGRAKLKRALRKLSAAKALSAFKDGTGTRWEDGWVTFDYDSPHRRRMGFGKIRRIASSDTGLSTDDSDIDMLGAFDNSIRHRRMQRDSKPKHWLVHGKSAKKHKGKKAQKKREQMVTEVKRRRAAEHVRAGGLDGFAGVHIAAG